MDSSLLRRLCGLIVADPPKGGGRLQVVAEDRIGLKLESQPQAREACFLSRLLQRDLPAFNNELESMLKSTAAVGTTTASTASKNTNMPSALPMKMALWDKGETSSPSKACSWRSRCQVRLSESTDANAVGSQIAPAAICAFARSLS